MIPKMLLSVYLVLFSVLAINPYDRSVWWAENIPTMLIVALLVYSYQRFQFSDLSYVLMSVFIYIHTIGGHFTFERVPFDFITELFNFERNHYDRMGHFSVGFYAYPIAELVYRKKSINSRIVLFQFPIYFILAVAGIYEILEWQYAIMADEKAGIAVLGSQGDIWDAQKDILADTLGALTTTVLFFIKHPNAREKNFI